MLKKLFRYRGGFRGGLFLPAPREPILEQSLLDFPLPARLTVPMMQHDGPPSRVAVSVGDRIGAGDLLGKRHGNDGLDVHAPVAGRVEGLVRVDTARATDVLAVHLATDGPRDTSDRGSLQSECQCPIPTSVDELADLADAAGLTNFREPAFSWSKELRGAAHRGVEHIIINALEPEPTLHAKSCLLAASLETILSVGPQLHRVLRSRTIWLVLDAARRQELGRCKRAAAGTPVRVVGLRNKYPQGHPVLLTKAIVERETPYGRSPSDLGVLVLEVDGVVALGDAAAQPGRMMVDRVVTVTGPAAASPGHYLIPVGTSFGDVLDHVGLRRSVAKIIDGGLMTGRAIESLDSVVTKQTCAVLLMDHESASVGQPGPCMRCGWCQEDCPVGLDPRALLDLGERDEIQEAASFYPQACIHCGICTYVCPSELPLAEAVTHLKQRVPRMDG